MNVTAGEVVGGLIGTSVGGFIIGMVVAAVVLIRLPQFYRKLARCVRPTTEPGDVLVVDDNLNGSRPAGVNYQYCEIDENNTQTFSRQQGGLDTVSFSRRDGYAHCTINGPQQKYRSLESARKSQSHANYEPVSVQRDTNDVDKDRSSGPIYHILEPGSNKRLPVKPLETDMLQEDHVYFKLELGSNRVVQVPRTIVNAAYGSRDYAKEDIYFVLDKMYTHEESTSTDDHDDSTCNAQPYAVNDVKSGPIVYTLESQ